jgi:hypothetical protein
MTRKPVPFPHGHPDDDRPLPEIVIGNLGGSMLHIDRDGTRYYRVIDWVYEVLGSKAKARHNPWRDLKKSIEKGVENFASLENADEKGQSKGGENRNTPWIALEYETDGGPQTSDFATDEGLYWITQHMSNRSKTVRDVKEFLASAGVFVDKARRNPGLLIDAAVSRYQQLGKEETWIRERLEGKVSRRQFTDALTEACAEILQSWQYGAATNTIYTGLWQRTSAKLREDMNLPASKSLRDSLPGIALTYLRIAEQTAALSLGQRQELTFNEAQSIVEKVARMIGQQAEQTSQYLGIDLPTGQPLLGDDS